MAELSPGLPASPAVACHMACFLVDSGLHTLSRKGGEQNDMHGYAGQTSVYIVPMNVTGKHSLAGAGAGCLQIIALKVMIFPFSLSW